MGSHSSKAPSIQENNALCKVCAGNFEPQVDSITVQSAKLNKPKVISSNNDESNKPLNLINLVEFSNSHKRQSSLPRYLPHYQQPYVKSYVHHMPHEVDFHHVGMPPELDMLEYHRSTTPVPVPMALPTNYNPKSYNLKQSANPYKEQKVVYRPVQYKFIPKQTPVARNDISSYYDQLVPNKFIKQRRINVV